MLLIIMILIKLAFAIAFIAFLNLIAKGMFALSGMLYKVGEAAFDSNTTQNDIVKIPYPMNSQERVNGNLPEVARRNGAFFDDTAGVDLEYRGVGVAEDRRAARVLGQNVPARTTRKHGRSR